MRVGRLVKSKSGSQPCMHDNRKTLKPGMAQTSDPKKEHSGKDEQTKFVASVLDTRDGAARVVYQ